MSKAVEVGVINEQLVVKREPRVLSSDGYKVVVELDITGEIAPKEGKETHVTLSGNLKVPRFDGKVYTIGINGWYK